MVLHSLSRSLGGEGHKQKDREASVEVVALEEVPLVKSGVLDQL